MQTTGGTKEQDIVTDNHDTELRTLRHLIGQQTNYLIYNVAIRIILVISIN